MEDRVWRSVGIGGAGFLVDWWPRLGAEDPPVRIFWAFLVIDSDLDFLMGGRSCWASLAASKIRSCWRLCSPSKRSLHGKEVLKRWDLMGQLLG